MTHFPGKQNLRPKNIQDHAEGLAGFGLAGRLAHVSGLGFGTSLLGVARFVLCDSSGQLCRAVPALFLTGVSQSELSCRWAIIRSKAGCTVRGGVGTWVGGLCWIVCELGLG